MKKIIAEIVIEETDTTSTIYLLEDIIDALQNFKSVNLAWSKIHSVAIDGIRLGDDIKKESK
jgi:hypothetical protein